MRWNEAVTLKFVKLYMKHECLWNPTSPGYKLKYQRDKAYVDICSEFNASTGKSLSVPEVKMKIKNLRTTYSQQVSKILEKSSPNSIYEPSLIWFHEMDRCLKHVSNARNGNNCNMTQGSPVVDSTLWVEGEFQNSNMDCENPDPLTSQTEDEYEERSEIKLERQSPIYYRKSKKKKMKHKVKIDYSNDSNLEATLREDEFDIYGKYIASQLRKMDLHKALRLQLQIQNLVGEARIADVTCD